MLILSNIIQYKPWAVLFDDTNFTAMEIFF